MKLGAPEATGLPVAEGRLVAAVACAAALAPLNSTMILVSLPSIMAEFAVDSAAVAWLVTGYLIAMASVQPIAGKLGDRLGRRGLVLGGLCCFGVASLAAAHAPNLAFLVGLRVLQAISGALALPNGVALVREHVPPERRASRFGLVDAAIGIAAAAGPPIGGFAVGLAGWRAMFLVNVLVILPVLLLGWRVIPRRRPSSASAQPRVRFDFAGAALLCGLLVGCAGLLTQLRRSHDGLPQGPSAFAILVLLCIFLWWESRHPEPVFQPRFFRRPGFAAASGAVALSNLAMYSMLLVVPLLLSRTGWGSESVGQTLAAMAVAMVVAAPFGGRLADQFGRRLPAVVGLGLLAIGPLVLDLAALAAPDGVPPAAVLAIGLAVAGAGLGLASAALQTSALESVESRHAGVAAGVYSTSRYFGSIVGSSVLAGLLASGQDTSFASVFTMIILAAVLSMAVAFAVSARPLPLLERA